MGDPLASSHFETVTWLDKEFFLRLGFCFCRVRNNHHG